MANTKKYVSLDKLGLYDTKIKAYLATADEAVLESANAYADSLASNYDAAGAAATAESNAKSYTDGKVTDLNGTIAGVKTIAEQGVTNAATADAKAVAAQGDVDALEAYVGTFTASEGVDTVVKYIDAKTAGIASDAALNELKDVVTQLGKDIDAVEDDYLKAADKTELEGKITTAQNAADAAQNAVNTLSGTHATDKAALEAAIAKKADQTALDAVSAVANAAVKQSDYDVKVKALEDEDARIAGLVEAEAAKAREEEGKLDARLVKVETFFEKAEDETIDEALDTLVELQKYLEGEGAVADQMLLDIAANKKAIEDHAATDHDFAAADATLKSELEAQIVLKADKTTVEGIDGRLTTAEGKITTAEGKISTLEGEMDAVEAAVAKKAEQSALESAVEALEGADATLLGKIEVLEGKFTGEGSVEDQIATAKQEAIDAAAGDATTKANKALEDAKKYADEEDAKIESRVEALEAASATHALASELNTLAGRVTTAEGEIDTLQTEMDAVEALATANKAAHEANAAAIALKASQADLTKVSDRVTAIETWHENFVEVSEEEINELFK